MQPTSAVDKETIARSIDPVLETVISWTKEETWELRLFLHMPIQTADWSAEMKQFWPTFQWNDNPWIRDRTGAMLTTGKYGHIRPCKLEELHIQRTGVLAYTFAIPRADGQEKLYTQAKLRRWGLAILMGSPQLDIGEELSVKPGISMRHPPELHAEYEWSITKEVQIMGIPQGKSLASIILSQEPDGIHWKVEWVDSSRPTAVADADLLHKRQQRKGIVFYAHPYAHRFPWGISDTVTNRHAVSAIKRLAFRRYKEELGSELGPVLARLEQASANDQWQTWVMHRTPSQLWEHKNTFTEYQLWVDYRLAVRQLNLYFEGRQGDNGCWKLEQCSKTKKTLTHIFWECPCAQACWRRIVCQWTGQTWSLEQLQQFLGACASHKAPPLLAVIKDHLNLQYMDDVGLFVEEWKRIWAILCAVCVTTLWIQRNRVVHQGDHVTIIGSLQEFWASATRHLQAVGKRERLRPQTKLQGTRLLLCVNLLIRKPTESPPRVGSHDRPPDPRKPALLSWLRKFQTACVSDK